MAKKPFTPDAEVVKVNVADAYGHVAAAIVSLEKAMAGSAHWSEHETLQHFQFELGQFLSCDNDEGGFGPTYRKETKHDINQRTW